jgi:hypothetical protein
MENNNIDVSDLIKQYNEHVAAQTQEIMVLRAMVTKLKAQLNTPEVDDKVE